MYVASTKQETYILIEPLNLIKFHTLWTYIGLLDHVDHVGLYK
jgi:hypothetical protein